MDSYHDLRRCVSLVVVVCAAAARLDDVNHRWHQAEATARADWRFARQADSCVVGCCWHLRNTLEMQQILVSACDRVLVCPRPI